MRAAKRAQPPARMDDDVAAIAAIDAVPTILDVVCNATGMGFAAVARVTEDRWVACAVRDDIAFGLKPGGELAVETTICHEIRASRVPVVIDHVADDPAFRAHHVPLRYGFQSYISMPILLPDGTFFGTLCAIDPEPRRLASPETIGMFKLFADLIAFHLDARQRLEASETLLSAERRTAQEREQFIAVLGHDLRNPLAAISAGTEMLLRKPDDTRTRTVVGRIRSSVDRMAGLIDDVLDLARGRFAGGLTLERNADEPLRPVLEQVVAELQAAAEPERRIEARFAMTKPVDCDRERIGQLLSNLVGNALVHGDKLGAVSVSAATRGGTFELSVANAGPPIPAASLDDLFKPFHRPSTRAHRQGLGLGLYIASEIARAHGGTLTATSSPQETRFTFSMPLR